MKNTQRKNVWLRLKNAGPLKIIAFLLIALYTAVLLYLLLWGLLTAFKDEWDFVVGKNIFGLPSKEFGWCFTNFKDAYELFEVQIKGTNYASAIQQYGNSLLYAGGVTVVAVLSKLLVAYAVAKYNFFLKKILYFIAIFVMLLPIVGSLPSMLRVLRFLGIYDTYLGVLFMNCGFTGMYFLLYHAAFSSISDTYREAAEIDGAGHFTVLFKIMMPLVSSTTFAISIMTFIQLWNAYEQPMLYLPSMPTIAYGLFQFSKSSHSANAPALMSAAYMVCIPTIILFIIFRDKIMVNVSVGGIKG